MHNIYLGYPTSKIINFIKSQIEYDLTQPFCIECIEGKYDPDTLGIFKLPDNIEIESKYEDINGSSEWKKVNYLSFKLDTNLQSKVYFRACSNKTNPSLQDISFGGIRNKTEGKLKVSGNILTLLNASGKVDEVETQCFLNLFKYQKLTDILSDVSELIFPKIKGQAAAYSGIFYNTSISSCPIILDDNDSTPEGLFWQTFENCSNLEKISLPKVNYSLEYLNWTELTSNLKDNTIIEFKDGNYIYNQNNLMN